MFRRIDAARALAGLFLVCALAVGLSPSCTPPGAGETPPGILLITVDGLVVGDTSLGGGTIPAPALERLAGGARLWSDAWTASPLTRPAAATYLTGLAPDRHRVLDDLYDRLPEDAADLGSLLTAAGYRTAAFSESSGTALGSGLTRGFELVDPAPEPNNVFRRHSPNLRVDGSRAEAFATWVATVPEGERWFAWVHLAMPFRAQQQPRAEGAAQQFGGFDSSLAQVLDALEARGDDAVVLLAGTFGLVTGPPGKENGLGTSMDESALQVPVLARAPGVERWRPAGELVWAPDVPATIAELAGVELPDGEGVSLTGSAPADRIVWAGSRVPLDQLGWTPIAAVRQGDARVAREGGIEATSISDPGAALDDATRERLVAALDARPVPLGDRLPLDVVAPLLERVGVAIDPAPEGGRDVPAGPERDAIVQALWENRRLNGFRRSPRAFPSLVALVEAAPESSIPPVDLGLYRVLFQQDPTGAELAGGSAGRYPTHPEVVRWFALAVLDEDLAVAEELLLTALVVRPADAYLLYDLACVRARQGDVDGALDRLRSAVAAGFAEWDLMSQDPDLRPLRESGDLARLMREVRR